MKNIFKRATALLLSLLMVFSVCSTSLIIYATDGGNDVPTVPTEASKSAVDVNGDGKITYVSLGESMTNGYGTVGYYPTSSTYSDQNATVADKLTTPEEILETYLSIWPNGQNDGNGLDRWGTKNNAQDGMTNTFGLGQTAVDSYPAFFAEYLESQNPGYTVEWKPWAISGQRPEEFYWLMQDQWETNYNNGNYLDAGSDENQTLFENDGTYNGDMYTTYIWKNGNHNEDGVSRFLAAKYGRWGTTLRNVLRTTSTGGNIKDQEVKWTIEYENNSWVQKFYSTTETAEKKLYEFREEYKAAISGADVISVNLGTHSFSSVVSARMLAMLTNGTDIYADTRTTVQSILEAFPEYESVYDAIASLLNENIDKMLPGISKDIVNKVFDTYAYATLSFMVTYDQSLQIIRKLNPDAEIVVLGMSNFMDGADFGGALDLGALFGVLVDFTNLYRAGWVEGAENCIFVPADYDMGLLIDDLAAGDVNYVYLAAIVNNTMSYSAAQLAQLGLSSIDHAAVIKYLWTRQKGDAVSTGNITVDAIAAKTYDGLKEIASMTSFDGTAAISAFANGEYLSDGPTCLAKMLQAENGVKDLSAADQISLYLWVRSFMGDGIGCHPSVAGHETVYARMVECWEAGYTGKDYTDAELDKMFVEFYYILKNDETFTSTEKVALMEKLYAVINDSVDLSEAKEVKVAVELYTNLKSYIDDDQIMSIVLTVYGALLDKKLDDAETMAIIKHCYETVLLTQATDEVRLAIVRSVYNILDAQYKLSEKYGMLEVLINLNDKLVEEKHISSLQSFAIIHFTYLAYANDGQIDAKEFRVIANLIYYVIFGTGTPMMKRANVVTVKDWSTVAGEDLAVILEAIKEEVAATEGKTATEKIDVIATVYTEIKNSDAGKQLIEENPQVEAVGELMMDLTGRNDGSEQLLSDETTAKIIEVAFTNLIVPEPENVDVAEAITNITTTITEEVLFNPEMDDEKVNAIIGKVTETVGKLTGSTGGEGGSGAETPVAPALPDLTVVRKLLNNLQAEDLLTADQATAIISKLVSTILSGNLEPAALVDEIYFIVYNEGFDAVKTAKIVIVITETLIEEGYADAAVVKYVEPYYQMALAQYVDIEEVKGYVDTAIKAVAEALAAVGTETDLEKALRAELEATLATLVEVREALNGDVTSLKYVMGVILDLEDDLYAHVAAISELALQAGYAVDPYIQNAIAAANHYINLVNTSAVKAYNWLVNEVDTFVENYLALVDTISAEVSKFDPTVGAAVRDFMINTPADALAIICTAGADAVAELIDRAVNYGNAVADAAIDLAFVVKKYGVAIYNAIVNDDTCKALYAELLDVYDQILAIESLINKPSDIGGVAQGIYEQLPALKDYAIDLAGRFYDAAIAAVKKDDYLTGTELEDALNALVAALATIDDEAIDYAEWLGQRAGAMGGALLASLLENWDALYTASWPIIVQKATDLYNYVKDYILNYDYDALIQKIIDAAIKIAPEVDAYLYDFFYNNPDKVDAFFREYGDEIVELCEKYGVYALGVIGVALAEFGPDMVDYIINNPEEVLAGLVAWAEKYGARVADILQVYAEYYGICGAVREELAALEAQLQALYQQLETAYGEARERILDEIARVQAKIELINAKLQAVVIAINNLNAALKYFVSDVVGGYVLVIDAINALDAAIRELLNSVSDTLADKLEALIQNGLNFTAELLKSLADLAVESLIKFAPELDAYLYDFFYNNPDKVVAFFTEYGDEIVELCKKYGDEVLGILMLALAEFGPEVVDYIINNPEEALAGLVAWAEKYGQRVADILQVYAEYLGLCQPVQEEIANLRTQLAELYKQLEELYKQLETAIGEEYNKILGYINQIQALIAQIEAQINTLIAKLNTLIDAINRLNAALKQLIQDGIDAFGAIQQALNDAAYAIIDLVNELSEDVAGKIEALIKSIKDYLNNAYDSAILADYIINKDSKYVAFGDNAEAAELFALALAAKVAEKNFGYSYKFDLTNAKDGAKITDLMATIMTNPAVVADADLISIGYSYDQIAEDTIYTLIDLLVFGEVKGEVELPTAEHWNSLVGTQIANEVLALLAEVEAELIANGLNVSVAPYLAQFDTSLAEIAKNGKTISEATMAALEYFAYNVVEYAVLVPQAIAMINQINPDALVMLNAISNPVSGWSVSYLGFELTFGDYLDYVVDAIYVESLALAAINDSVVFVPTTEIETTYTGLVIDGETIWNWVDYIASEGKLKCEITPAASAAAYIAEKMYEALNITVDDGILGDVNSDGEVNALDIMYYQWYLVDMISEDDINLSVADVDGANGYNALDIMYIRWYLVDMIAEFPAE